MSNFKTLEEYREYKRAYARKWYEANKEKKKEYQRKRYHQMIEELKQGEQVQ